MRFTYTIRSVGRWRLDATSGRERQPNGFVTRNQSSSHGPAGDGYNVGRARRLHEARRGPKELIWRGDGERRPPFAQRLGNGAKNGVEHYHVLAAKAYRFETEITNRIGQPSEHTQRKRPATAAAAATAADAAATSTAATTAETTTATAATATAAAATAKLLRPIVVGHARWRTTVKCQRQRRLQSGHDAK